jgi:hypothetical protein
VGWGCEKSGWTNSIILFHLINIPTVGARSSPDLTLVDVKKWDKQVARSDLGTGLPRHAIGSVWFSKT